MRIWPVVTILAVAVEVFGQVEFKDSQTHDIGTIIKTDVWVDYDAPGEQTTVNLYSGGISEPYHLKGYTESNINLSGGSSYWLDAYNNSRVVISGGELNRLWAYDSSHVNISSGKVPFVWTLDNSSIEVSGGQIGGCISVYDNSRVHISGNSRTNTISSFNTSRLDVSGGWVQYLSASDSTTVEVSGGEIAELYISNMYRGQERVNISGGNVGTLRTQLFLEGNERFNLTENMSVADLMPFGIRAVESCVDTVEVYTMTVNARSTANIYGGRMFRLAAQDSSTVNLSDGSLFNLSACENSTVSISGGNITGELCFEGGLWVNDNSTVNISGGSISVLSALNNSSVNISGGEIAELRGFSESLLTIFGFDFELAGGLVWADDRQTIVEGTGILTGKWFGETESWMIPITLNDASATIIVIPEPCTLLLLGLGGVLLRKQR